MMTHLADYGAAVVGFDVLFAERDESADVDLLRDLAEQEQDQAFLQSIRLMGTRCPSQSQSQAPTQ